MLAIAVPWYYLAEQETPGFLQYFLVGEHFERYVTAEWAGDPYGSVKDRPPGTIWIYFLVACLPWSPLVVWWFGRHANRTMFCQSLTGDERPLISYLLIWALLPCIFFTPARNVLVTYILPGMPAAAILVAWFSSKAPYRTAIGTMVLFYASSLGVYFFHFDEHRYNARAFVDEYHRLNEREPGPLVITGDKKFSIMFYTGNQVVFSKKPHPLWATGKVVYVGVRDRWLEAARRSMGSHCRSVFYSNDLTLFRCGPG